MRGLRTLLAAIFAVGILASGATSVSANDTPNAEVVIPPGPGMAELHKAIDEFRAAISDLRDACRSEREQLRSDVTTARKRQPTAEITECEKTLKALKAEFQTIKQKALELEYAYRNDIISKRQQEATAVAKAKEDAARQKLEQAQKEAQKAAENKPATAPKPVSASDELAKKRHYLDDLLKSVDATIVYKQGLLKQSQDAAAEYRAKAATLTGADKERYLAKAAQADKDAAQWASYVKEYTARHDEIVAALAKLGTVTAPSTTPKPEDAAYKKAKLEQALKDLNDKIAYKWSESDRSATLAADLRNQAAAATSDELRAKLLAKATEADKAADEWAKLAHQLEDQRDELQKQLDALTTLKT